MSRGLWSRKCIIGAGWQIFESGEQEHSVKLSAILLCLMVLTGVCSKGASSSVDQKTPRELMQYIEDAQKLGLRDDAIKQNALRAGWDATSVEQAFSLLSRPG